MKCYCALILAVLFLTACETIPDTTQLELQKPDIKSVAILPLVLGDADRNILGGPGAEGEIAGFMAYWKDNFNSNFREKIKLIEGIEVKYAGEDFVKAIPAKVDYGQLLDELGVDAVLGFNLVRYNETQVGTGFALALIGMQENATAEFKLHFYYLHMEDWSPHLDLFPGPGTSRGTIISEVIGWLDRNWPLSVNFKKSSEKDKGQ
jgi:hypothetical protein